MTVEFICQHRPRNRSFSRDIAPFSPNPVSPQEPMSPGNLSRQSSSPAIFEDNIIDPHVGVIVLPDDTTMHVEEYLALQLSNLSSDFFESLPNSIPFEQLPVNLVPEETLQAWIGTK